MLLLKKIISGTTDQNNTENLVPETCSYPLDVELLFPIWLKETLAKDGTTTPTLIDLLKEYYKWIYCKSKSDPVINKENVGFFELNKLKNVYDLSTTPLFLKIINTYFPSAPLDAPSFPVNKTVSLTDSIKNRLYSKKGTEASLKYLISQTDPAEELKPQDVYITYPKKYLMILNGGSNDQVSGCELGYKGLLNFSVLQDNNYWNDYTYIVNCFSRGASFKDLKQSVNPVVHPAGLNGLYQQDTAIFNPGNENFDIASFEVPQIKNYFAYTLQSNTTTTPVCQFGTTQYVYPPTWDYQIQQRRPSPSNFGEIYIWEMFDLFSDPAEDPVFPNESRTCP